MPKKHPRNAFYFYMLDFKEQERLKGVMLGNMNEVAEAAGPSWTNAHPAVRSKYEAMAKKEKERTNVPTMKFTSWGESFADLAQRQKDETEAENREEKDIKNIVMLKGFNESLLREQFYVMDVNFYCKTNTLYVICEFSIIRFSLLDGIIDEYHEMVNPGSIPVGYTSDAKLACTELGMELPDPDSPTDLIMSLSHIHEYLSAALPESSDKKTLPPIFTMPKKVPAVQSFIHQLCNYSGENSNTFKVYKINTLYYYLANAVASNKESEGLPKPSLALAQLTRDIFQYHTNLGCDLVLAIGMRKVGLYRLVRTGVGPHWCIYVQPGQQRRAVYCSPDQFDQEYQFHEGLETEIQCTASRSKRWAFTILDHCCLLRGIKMIPGKHLPDKLDLEGIAAAKEQQSEHRTTVANSRASQYDAAHTAPYSWESAPSVASDVRPSSEIRKPNADRTSAWGCPDISVDAFPQIKGSGRGIPSRSSDAYPVLARGQGMPPVLSEEEFPSLGGIGRGKRIDP